MNTLRNCNLPKDFTKVYWDIPREPDKKEFVYRMQ